MGICRILPLLLLCGQNAVCQQYPGETIDSTYQSVCSLFYKELGSDAHLYTGANYPNDDPVIKGNPIFNKLPRSLLRGSLSTTPDFRNVLLWDPSIDVENGKRDISFYTSDIPGEYLVVVEGATAGGKPVYTTTRFRVNPASGRQ